MIRSGVSTSVVKLLSSIPGIFFFSNYISCYVIFFFFFNESGDPRDLPSSPPRPSPDLRLAPLLDLAPVAERDRERVDVDPRLDLANKPLANAVVVGEEVTDAQALPLVRAEHDVHPLRSEEHTSELQSPCNLVCRLLLEK